MTYRIREAGTREVIKVIVCSPGSLDLFGRPAGRGEGQRQW